MEPGEIDEADAYNYDGAGFMVPEKWYRHGDTIGFLPTPSESSSAFVYSQFMPDDLSADGDTLVLPDYTRNAIVFKAAEYAAAAKGNDRMAMIFAAQYKEQKTELELRSIQNQTQKYPAVGEPYGDEDYEDYEGGFF